MPEPITYRQLVEELDKRFDHHDQHHIDIKKLLTKHDSQISGDNGVPGLRIRVDRIETTNSNIKKFVGFITAGFALFLSWLGVKSGS